MGAVLMSLTSWYYGPDFWHHQPCFVGDSGSSASWYQRYVSPHLPLPILNTIGTWRNADLLVMASSIAFVQEVVLKFLHVGRRHGLRSLLDLLPFFTLAGCSLLVASYHIDVWLHMPRTCLHLCALLFVEMTTALMLAHVSKETYQPFRWLILPLVLITILVVAASKMSPAPSVFSGLFDLDDEQQLENILLVYTSGVAVYLLMKTSVVIHEICTLLNIWCFDIVTPRQTKQKQQQQQMHRKSCEGSSNDHYKAE